MTAAVENLSTSDQIRIMACDLFCRDGYNGVGMRSLAAAIGIGAGSLYNHIDSKQALLNELITDYELNLLHVFRSPSVSKAKTPSQMVALLWQQVDEFVTRNRNLALLARKEWCNLTIMQTKRISIVRRKRIRELYRLLTRMPDVSLGGQGLQDVAEELYTLLDCNANLIIDSTADTNGFVRRQLRDMACMMMVKRD